MVKGMIKSIFLQRPSRSQKHTKARYTARVTRRCRRMIKILTWCPFQKVIECKKTNTLLLLLYECLSVYIMYVTCMFISSDLTNRIDRNLWKLRRSN